MKTVLQTTTFEACLPASFTQAEIRSPPWTPTFTVYFYGPVGYSNNADEFPLGPRLPTS